MAKQKDHHYVARGYLRGFGNGTGKGAFVWIHERGAKTAYRKGIRNVAYKKHYYAFAEAAGELNIEAEKVLGQVESDALNVIRPMLQNDKSQPDRLGRQRVALFVALQEARIPWARSLSGIRSLQPRINNLQTRDGS